MDQMTLLRDLAKRLAPVPNAPEVRLHQGVVTVVSGSEVYVQLSASLFQTAMRYLHGSTPVVNDTVWVLQNGSDYFCLGKLGPSIGATFAGNVIAAGDVSASSLKAAGRSYFSDGLELAQPSSTPYIDFHRSSNPAEATDFNVRLINEATDQLRLYCVSGGRWGIFRSGGFMIGAYGWDANWAHFGAPEAFDASNKYAFMSHANGSVLMNAWGGECRLRWSGNDRLSVWNTSVDVAVRLNVTGGISTANDWFRSQASGAGWHHDMWGGGWQMQDGTFVRLYGSKQLRAENRVLVEYDQTSQYDNRGVHSRNAWGDQAGYSANSPGFACNWYISNARGERLICSTWNDGSHAGISAISFDVGASTIEIKKNVESLDRSVVKKIRPVKFQMKRRGNICLYCEGTGTTTPADYVEKRTATPRSEDTPPELLEPIDCPYCSHNGTPGQINTPALDLNEARGHAGFIVEEVVEYAPEVVVWEPSDLSDPMSEPRPMGISVMGMVAIVAQGLKELDARLDQLVDELEAKK